MEERISKIQKYIKKNGEASLKELGKMFPGVSSMTLRRDLAKLEQSGEIILTRGGAKSLEYISRLREEQYFTRVSENVEEKRLVAHKAFALLKQDSAVFFDSGTTITALASLITDEKLFIVTAAPNIAIDCAKNENSTVYMTGGILNGRNLSLSGAGALDFLDNINIDVAFMAASGFSTQNAFTCGNYDECLLKKKAIDRAGKVIMLIDSTKIGRSMPFTFAVMQDLDCIVTDAKAGSELINAARKNNVEVI